ncbi:MAG: homoserine kinase [Acidaminococcaceae bacterium]|jgi:homoserine kinase|nr:homoserine kinase [Acidaminococcaceae bacterium]
MRKSVTIKIPATSANCGPAFDCMGLACTLYDEFTYAVSDEEFGFHLKVTGEGAGMLHPSGRNLAFASFLHVWNQYTQRQRVGISLIMHNDIPMSRGLGSSSAAIVGGVMAASILSGANLTTEALLNVANKIEGHPDNVAPALYGGFTISCLEEDVPHCLRFLPAKPLQFIAVVPEKPLATSLARKAIPHQIPLPDAVFNESRSALLAGALLSGRYEFLPLALEDKLHQPYRAHLIPGMEDVFQAGLSAGAYHCIISGAGSTLMAYADPAQDGAAIGQAMVNAFAAHGQKAAAHLLTLDTAGAKIL